MSSGVISSWCALGDTIPNGTLRGGSVQCLVLAKVLARECGTLPVVCSGSSARRTTGVEVGVSIGILKVEFSG